MCRDDRIKVCKCGYQFNIPIWGSCCPECGSQEWDYIENIYEDGDK